MPLSAEFEAKCLEALNELGTRFKDPLDRLVSGDLRDRLSIEALPLETLLQFLKDVEGDDALAVCDVYRSSPDDNLSNVCHKFLATVISRGYGPVVTVNIDHLIEDELSRTTQNWHDQVHADVSLFPEEPAAGNLYKLHGTVESRETLRMTLDRVTPQLGSGAERLFGTFIRSGPVCFVGWAGADLDLRPLILREGKRWSHPVFFVVHAREGLATEEDFRRRNRLAFDLIDGVGARPLFTTGERMCKELGDRVLGLKDGHRPGDEDHRERDRWNPLHQWARTRERPEFLAGRTAGYIYFQLGLHRDACSIWRAATELAPDPAARSAVFRDMAHALFREHDIRGALRENREAMRAAVEAGDRLAEAHSLFGLGSVPVAWPLADPRSFVVAGRRLRNAIRTFRGIRRGLEASAEGRGASKGWRAAAFGEATSLYWLGRWEHRWLGPLVPVSRLIRARLAARYERARQLLCDERVNAVNEVANPLRSLALVRVYDDQQQAKRCAQDAERLVRWTGDRQRLSTVLRDVALVHTLSGTPGDLQGALRYWSEALIIASERSLPDPSVLANRNPASLALEIARELREPVRQRRLADANGVSQALYGIAGALATMGSTHIGEADEVLRVSIDVVRALPLPVGSKLLHLLRLCVLRLRVRIRRAYVRAPGVSSPT